MKTKPINQNNVNIITLGCSKNLVDSEQIASQLSSNNFNVDFENTKLKNQITIINTCGFIESAKQQSLNTILQYAQLKSDNKIKKLIVTGCLSQRYKDELKQEIPEVDHWYGTLDLPLLLKDLNINYQKELLNRRLLSTPKHYAYLKISEGCNRTCSFCAIPLMRGGHISKPIETIIQEAKFLVSQGVKEIMLIAQELTYYGLDLYKKRALATLLEKLVTIDGLIWIRLHYAYPQNFPLDILEIMQQEPKICKYLDIPLQHASNSMLKSMQRQITQNDIKHLITKIKTKIPNITLRSTFIVGFPNETNQDFNELKSFIQEIKFDRLGVFTYSHEENTKAYQLKDTTPESLKQGRRDDIMQIQNNISYQKNLEKINKEFLVIIDSKEAGRYIGRSEADSVDVDNEVIVNSAKKLEIGQFYKVKITKAFDYDIEGEVM